MKKIGLTTCFINNYGACLQAHALQTTIENLGFCCEIINFTEPLGYPKNNTVKDRIKTISAIKEIYARLKPSVRKSYEVEKKFGLFKKNYLNISSREYKTTADITEHPPVYDAYVCGSDQIWNPKLYGRNNAVYFLDFAPKGKKRIAYAPSIGLHEFPFEYAADFKNLIDKMDVISVREAEGKKIIDEQTDKTARVVLDPTLLHDSAYWSQLTRPVKLDVPFIFCYVFGDKPYMHEVIERLQSETGYLIVYTDVTKWGSKIKNAELASGVGPSEFVWLIKNAEFIITDSFHATAFSLNFNTPFYTMLRNDDSDNVNMNSRIYSILEKAGLEERIVSSKTIPEKMNYTVDFREANKKLQECREQDINFLKASLEGI